MNRMLNVSSNYLGFCETGPSQARSRSSEQVLNVLKLVLGSLDTETYRRESRERETDRQTGRQEKEYGFDRAVSRY